MGYDYRQKSVSKDETFYSAPVELTAGKEYKESFDVLNNVNGSLSLNVAYGKDKTMAAQTNTILALSDQASDDWSTMSKTFKPSESGTYYVSFWLHDSPCAFFYMDNIRIEEVLKKNLEATSVRNLNTDPTVGESISTGVTYTNIGSGKSASKFILQLLDDADNVLGSKTISRALSAGASATANIQWTAPKEAGAYAVRGRVVMDGDECESDNTTAQSWLNIQPQGVKAVTIGTGTEVSGSIPFSSDGSTFFETVYHAKDMQSLAGKIDSLAIKVRMGQDRDYLKVPFRVYLGVTDRYDMNKGRIPVSEDMTEVFNGTLDFKRGSYELVIPFSEPFEYVGGNLAMLIIGDYDSSLFLNRGEGIGAYVSEAGLGASRNLAYYDVKQDPENPDDNAGNFYSLIPNTVFFFDHTQTGKVTGKVTDTEGNAVKGITVKQYEYPTQNLVLGYTVVANEGSYPVGFDAGPAVEGGAVFGSNTNSAPVEWASTKASDRQSLLSDTVKVGIATAIKDISTEGVNTAGSSNVYDLTGRYVGMTTADGRLPEALPRGVYVVRGRKVVSCK